MCYFKIIRMLVFTDEYFIISGNYFRSVCNYTSDLVSYIPPNITRLISRKYSLKAFRHRYYYRESYVKLWHPKSLE